ncbi:MAG: hypothetical protein ACRD12_10865 [Acidimicrobiales bacterium]
MNVDTGAARSFLATHGRILDRRRLDLLLGDSTTQAGPVLAALDGYRNPDGGYGWGLEPDLRSAESQPTGGMLAFEVMAEVAPVTTPRAVELCDWLDARTLADGGLPLAFPVADPAGCAPWWANADPTTSSLQTTAQVAATAHLVARHDASVAGHPWLARATAWCVDAIARLDGRPFAYELLFAVRFLDALAEVDAAAVPLLDRLARYFPPDGVVPVPGGADGEHLRPLDFSPRPGGPARRLFTDEVIAAELDRLAQRQQPDGGWTVDFVAASPAAALEWRGYATVSSLAVLIAART